LVATIEQKKLVLRSNGYGQMIPAGVVDLATEVPEPLQSYEQTMLNDNGVYYKLAETSTLGALNETVLNDMAAAEPRLQVVGILSDPQLALLGVERDAP
jgi:hypothetical protein